MYGDLESSSWVCVSKCLLVQLRKTQSHALRVIVFAGASLEQTITRLAIVDHLHSARNPAPALAEAYANFSCSEWQTCLSGIVIVIVYLYLSLPVA